jgi:hypothetical protein
MNAVAEFLRDWHERGRVMYPRPGRPYDREKLMIKGKMSATTGRQLVLLGLSHANLARLKADGLNGFIRVNGDELGVPFDILITAGATEAEMMDGLASLAGPETEIIDDRDKNKPGSAGGP